MSSFGPPPLVFIGGNHQPFARRLSQTAIGDQPHLATCLLRGGGPVSCHHQVGRPGWSAGLGRAQFAPVFGQKTARWAPMSCICVRACLELVLVLWWARGS